MLYKINLPDCHRYLEWIVDLQKRLITELCDENTRPDEVNDEWAKGVLSAMGIDEEWLSRFLNWQNEGETLLQRMKTIAGFSAVTKAAILESFDHDRGFAQNFDPASQQPRFLRGHSTLNEGRDIVYRFFESFYDPALYRGYSIVVDGQQVLFDRDKYLEEFKRANPHVSVCPMCDGGLDAPELDHYYPRAQYAYLSCHPYNLVPICGVCNGFGGKRTKVPLNLKSQDDQYADWFHPYLRPAYGLFSIEFVKPPKEKTTPVLRSDDPYTQIRLDNLTNLVDLRARWRKALINDYKSCLKMIGKIRQNTGNSLSEDNLCTELANQAEWISNDVGNHAFALVRKAFLEKAAQKCEPIYSELLAKADPNLDAVSPVPQAHLTGCRKFFSTLIGL